MDERRLQEIERKVDACEEDHDLMFRRDDLPHIDDVRVLIAEVRRLRKPEKVSVRIEPGETRQVNGVPWRNCNAFPVTLLSSED